MLNPYFQTSQITLYNQNCLEGLKALPDNSIDCCVTSPPYYGLRDYGTATWLGGNPDCDHVANPKATKTFGNHEFNDRRPSREATKTPGYYADICPKCGAEKVDYQIGIEPTVADYIASLQEIFNEVYRVLKPTGTCWVNLGDSFAGSGKHGLISNASTLSSGKGVNPKLKNTMIGRAPTSSGMKPKSLCLVPQRFALAALESGWIIRNEVIWSKAAPMPTSKKDAMTVAHETIWFMVKNPKYFYDYEAVKQPSSEAGKVITLGPKSFSKGQANGKGVEPSGNGKKDTYQVKDFRNLWDVWHLSPDPVPDAHFATFPREIPRRAILAGCPPDGVVLDPFAGSGTTLTVAKELGRKAIGFELNPDYCAIAAKRCNQLTIFGAL